MTPAATVPGVEAFWESEPGDGRRWERVMPTGRAQVVVDLDNHVATLVGPRTTSAVVETPNHAMGFSLSGSGLARIVGGDAHQLVDTTVDLRDLVRAVRLPIDVDGERGPALRKLACELLDRFDVDERVVTAEHLLRSGHPAHVIANRLGVDRRRFVPSFRAAVGLAPKHYAVLARFQRANHLLRADDDESLSSIAFGLGYADQAHMTREVRRLSGRTPREVRILPPGPPNHVAAVDSST